MNDQIVCPNCKQLIPLTEALSHQIQEKYQQFYKKRLSEEKTKIEETLKVELKQKIQADLELQMKDKANELEELRKQNQALQEQLLETNKLIRQLKTQHEQGKLELEKKLSEEQEKIRIEEKKRSDEEYKLKILEKDKKLEDAMKMVDEYKRKLEQGSQQLQGEVLELELENILKREFPYDDIKPIPKGIRGADVMQIVKTNSGRECGVIIWESKRTKAWSAEWVSKLKEDQRQMKAEVAVIISQNLPATIKNFGLEHGVWVGNFECIIGLSSALRSGLIEVAAVKQSSIGKQEKMEVLYEYLSGTGFKQRVEAIIEAFTAMQADLEKEKRWFTAKWAKQESNIRRVIDNTIGMHGDLQSIMGKTLADLGGLDMLPEAEEKPHKDTLF